MALDPKSYWEDGPFNVSAEASVTSLARKLAATEPYAALGRRVVEERHNLRTILDTDDFPDEDDHVIWRSVLAEADRLAAEGSTDG